MKLLLMCTKIFLARMTDVCLGTFRTVNVIKGRKVSASIIAFIEILIWYFVARTALTHAGNSWYIAISYSGGFAVGTYIGTVLSDKLIGGHLTLNVVSNKMTKENINLIKDNGFGLSIINNEDGKTMFIMEIDKKYLKEAKNLIKSIDSNAFIVASETKFVSNGFIK